jgi:hypothetical protein
MKHKMKRWLRWVETWNKHILRNSQPNCKATTKHTKCLASAHRLDTKPAQEPPHSLLYEGNALVDKIGHSVSPLKGLVA